MGRNGINYVCHCDNGAMQLVTGYGVLRINTDIIDPTSIIYSELIDIQWKGSEHYATTEHDNVVIGDRIYFTRQFMGNHEFDEIYSCVSEILKADDNSYTFIDITNKFKVINPEHLPQNWITPLIKPYSSSPQIISDDSAEGNALLMNEPPLDGRGNFNGTVRVSNLRQSTDPKLNPVRIIYDVVVMSMSGLQTLKSGNKSNEVTELIYLDQGISDPFEIDEEIGYYDYEYSINFERIYEDAYILKEKELVVNPVILINFAIVYHEDAAAVVEAIGGDCTIYGCGKFDDNDDRESNDWHYGQIMYGWMLPIIPPDITIESKKEFFNDPITVNNGGSRNA